MKTSKILGTAMLALVAGSAHAYGPCDNMVENFAGAAVQGLVYGLTARAAGMNTHGARGVWGGATAMAYAQQRAECERAYALWQQEQMRRAEWERQQQYLVQVEAQRRQAEWERNNHCLAKTYEVNGRRVSDTRECMHVTYGEQYRPSNNTLIRY